ncbi:MAG: hypothetical protein M0R77_00570 [Gammaproteobacteria bacterium]|nr:hypothetical protein [Acholeplasmataceae bacterium]MCK9529047.1 hypothetical protein [Gammaproteobacteria bacterium]
MDLNTVNNRVANSVYLSKPTDKVAVADIYKDKKQGVINSIRDIGKEYGFNESLTALLRGSQDVIRLFPVVKSGLEGLSKENILNRVMTSTNLLRGVGANQLPEGWNNTVDNFYKNYGDYVVQIGNVSRVVNGTNFDNLQSVGNLVNRLAGESTLLFEDNDGLASLSASIIKEATQYGIPNSFDKVLQTVQNSDIMLKTANSCIPVAIEYSDIGMLRSISRTLGQGNLLNNIPSVLSTFSRQYGSFFGETFLDTKNLLNSLLETFDEVDEGWRTYERSGTSTEIDDVYVMTTASADMKNLISGVKTSYEWDDQKLQIGTSFSRVSVDEEIKRQLPRKADINYYNEVSPYLDI